MGSKLYVGNLSYRTTDDELRQAFEPYGQVLSASIVIERDTGRSKGFGFVEMNTEEEAKEAMAKMNGTQMGGRTIKVDLARPREDRPRGDRPRGDRGGRDRFDRGDRFDRDRDSW
jgi:RNA recognition motif-containing protein